MKLELGCGRNIAPGFIGVDIDPSVQPDVVADLRSLPFDDSSVEEIRAVHCIEHIPWQEVNKVLTEWARVLKPAGKIFIATPSLDFITTAMRDGRWKKDFDIFQPGEKEFCSVNGKPSVDKWANFKLFSSQLGEDRHCACYSANWLKSELERVGFKVVKIYNATALEIDAVKTGKCIEPTVIEEEKPPVKTATETIHVPVNQPPAEVDENIASFINEVARVQPTLKALPGRFVWMKRILLQLMRPFATQQIRFNHQVGETLKRLGCLKTEPAVSAPQRPVYYMGNNTILAGDIYGSKMYLPSDDTSITPCLLFDGFLEQWTTSTLLNILKPGMTFIDAGANVGFFTLLGAKAVGPAGKVYAFEPEPHTFSFLSRNVILNGLYWVKAENRALSDKTGKAPLFTSNDANVIGGHTLLSTPQRLAGPSVEVETITLDDFLKDDNHVDVMKIDVEGAELYILDGMKKVIAANPQIKIVMEFSPLFVRSIGRDPLKYIAGLRQQGFSIKKINHDGSMADINDKDMAPGANWLEMLLLEKE